MKKNVLSRLFNAAVITTFTFCVGFTSQVHAKNSSVPVLKVESCIFGQDSLQCSVTIQEEAVYSIVACEYLDVGCGGCELSISSKDQEMYFLTKREDGFIVVLTLKPGGYQLTSKGCDRGNKVCLGLDVFTGEDFDNSDYSDGDRIIVPLSDTAKNFSYEADENSVIVLEPFSNSKCVYEIYDPAGKKAEMYMNDVSGCSPAKIHYEANQNDVHTFKFQPINKNATGAVIVHSKDLAQ